jgi:uncharacterized damage-inducible protein DinB
MQTKAEIIEAYHVLWEEVADLITALSEDKFIAKPKKDTWSIAQEFDHVLKSATALCSAMKRSPFLLKWKFGKPNRPIRTYEEAKAKYYEKLTKVQGKAVAPSNFISAKNQQFNKENMLSHWMSTNQKFEQRINKWSDKNLDKVLLPHPLLGKMMVRELLYFTHFHTIHHLVSLKKKASTN